MSNSGVIIKHTTFRDNDEILTIFTPSGKNSLVAKGIKSGKRRSLCEVGNWIDFDHVKGKVFNILTEVVLKNGFYNEKSKYPFHIFYLCELLSKFEREDEDEKYIFHLLIDSLDNLSNNPDLSIVFFNLKFIEHEGIMPDFFTCPRCHERLKENIQNVFYGGSIYHNACIDSSNGISVDCIKLMRFIASCSSYTDIKVSNDCLRESIFITCNLIEEFLGLTLKTLLYFN